jgi:hypothetical protein
VCHIYQRERIRRAGQRLMNKHRLPSATVPSSNIILPPRRIASAKQNRADRAAGHSPTHCLSEQHFQTNLLQLCHIRPSGVLHLRSNSVILYTSTFSTTLGREIDPPQGLYLRRTAQPRTSLTQSGFELVIPIYDLSKTVRSLNHAVTVIERKETFTGLYSK